MGETDGRAGVADREAAIQEMEKRRYSDAPLRLQLIEALIGGGNPRCFCGVTFSADGASLLLSVTRRYEEVPRPNPEALTPEARAAVSARLWETLDQLLAQHLHSGP